MLTEISCSRHRWKHSLALKGATSFYESLMTRHARYLLMPSAIIVSNSVRLQVVVAVEMIAAHRCNSLQAYICQVESNSKSCCLMAAPLCIALHYHWRQNLCTKHGAETPVKSAIHGPLCRSVDWLDCLTRCIDQSIDCRLGPQVARSTDQVAGRQCISQ